MVETVNKTTNIFYRPTFSAAEQAKICERLTVEAAFERLQAEGLWNEIDEAGSQGTVARGMSERVAAICRSVAWSENQHTARHWLWCATIIMWLAVPFDIIAIPRAFTAVIVGHFVLTTMAFVLALRAWRDERSERFQGISSCLFAVTVMVAATMTGYQTGGASFERFAALGFFTMATGLVLMPLTIPWRLAFAGVLNASFILCQALNPVMDGAAGWLFTLYCSAFNVACLWTRYTFDRQQIEMTVLRLKEVRNSHLMKHMAMTDALTGLYNRAGMLSEMARLLSEAPSGQLLSVAMIDIDDFKRLNDSLGHAAGDDALRSVGSLFQRFSTSSGAICGRIGGEEFLVVLPGADMDVATHALQGVMERLDQMNLPNPGSRVAERVTVSVGVVATTIGEGTLRTQESLMREADVALYASKSAGRNRITKRKIHANVA